MRSKLVLTIAAFFILTTAFAQEPIWTKQTKVSEVMAFEKEVKSKVDFTSLNITIVKDFYPLADKYKVTAPLIAERNPVKYLPLNAEYYFTPSDSVLRLIVYDWEKNEYGNFMVKQQMWKEEAKKFDTYNDEYERIKAILVTQFGAPASSDKKAKEVGSSQSKYLSRETSWETNDLHAELSMVFSQTTYRIRLKMYWKK